MLGVGGGGGREGGGLPTVKLLNKGVANHIQ